MMGLEAKVKHLEFIQNIISRMANNSFLLKGWAITVVGALIALNKDGLDSKVIAIAFFLMFMFWVLDAFFLSQERLFRQRYDEVRKKEEGDIDFSMALEAQRSVFSDLVNVFFSFTLGWFYGLLSVAIFSFGYFL
jgi:hypothetical protein